MISPDLLQSRHVLPHLSRLRLRASTLPKEEVLLLQKGIPSCSLRECGNVLFLSLNKKRTKRSQPKGRYENAPSPMYPPRRVAICAPKIFRFSGHYILKILQFLSCKRSKIGTFLNAGWRCGGGFQRGRFFVAPLWLTSFGPFLVQRQEKDITALS